MDFLGKKQEEDSASPVTGINQLLDSMDFLGKAPPKPNAAPVGGMSQIDSFMGPPPLKKDASGGGGSGGDGQGIDLGAMLKLLGPLLGL